ncbi:MAG: helix-turn-helix transcriptional regulator [Verrucomicrobiota bacterium]
MAHDTSTKNWIQSPEKRLRLARDKRGLSLNQVALLAGMSVPECYDLETYVDEVATCIELALANLCGVLGIRARELFSEEASESKQISSEELVARIKATLEARGSSVSEFEERVGFTISPALANPSEVLSWNVDCLRFVCSEIGVKWIDALP